MTYVTVIRDDVSVYCVAPRFWFSRRWRLSVLSCVAVLIVTSQRISVDVALTAMLNHTATADNNRSMMTSLATPGGENVTGNNVSRDIVCFNTSDVDILTTTIFEYQV